MVDMIKTKERKTVSLKLTADLHKKLRTLAEKEHRTLQNYLIVNLVQIVEKAK